jgi:hypothetical protein
MVKLILGIIFILSGVVYGQDTYTPSACTHYASSTGSGSTCTYTSPCLVNSFWSIPSLPGKTLCLFNGTYTGSNSKINPPSGVSGTSGNPITVRALNDGQVLIDNQNSGWAVAFTQANGNNWLVAEGINAKNASQDGLFFNGGNDNVMRRVVGWDGQNGVADANIIQSLSDRGTVEDVAGWGMNSRKIFDGAQAGDLEGAILRRAWGEWNDHPEGSSNPKATLQIGYNTTDQRFENLLLTWDTLGQVGQDFEGIISTMTTNTVGAANDIGGTKLLGSIAYARPGASLGGTWITQSGNTSNLTYTDLVMFVAPGLTTTRPGRFFGCSNPSCTNNVCNNCLAVHAGTAIENSGTSGWTFPNLKTGNGLAAATGGTSAFTLLPGICTRYVNGALTSTPLWPWPMDLRIYEARVASGARALIVTDEIASILGAIPSECIATGDRANMGGRWIPSTFEPIMGPVLVWPTRQRARVSLDVAGHTNTAVSLVLTLEASYDNGVSWKFISSTTRKGGTAVDDVGAAETDMYVAGEIGPEVGGVKRRVRGRVTLPSGGFDTGGGFVEASN